MTDEKKKVFDLIPAEDPIKKTILQARHQALSHEDLTDGAKALFCLLLDYSLWPSMNKGIGRVVIAAGALAKTLHRSKRSIGNWKAELERSRFIWTKLWHMPNTWPIDFIHISALVPPDDTTQQPTSDGTWGTGKWRIDKPVPFLNGKKQQSVSHVEQKNVAVPVEKPTPGGKEQPLATASSALGRSKVCRPQRQVLLSAGAKSAVVRSK